MAQPLRGRLSRALMEVLAIVAYRQPVTVAEIDAVRGVGSDHAVRALAERRLVHEVGRKPVPGRPVLYGTTDQFLHHFLLEGLEALPPVGPLGEPGGWSPQEGDSRDPLKPNPLPSRLTPKMPDDETATLHADGENVPLESSGPYREEVEPQINAERMDDDAATAPRRDGTQGEKKPEVTQRTNPKNNANAKRD